GTRSVKLMPSSPSRRRRTAIRSGESAVRFAITNTLCLDAILIPLVAGCVPGDTRPERPRFTEAQSSNVSTGAASNGSPRFGHGGGIVVQAVAGSNPVVHPSECPAYVGGFPFAGPTGTGRR